MRHFTRNPVCGTKSTLRADDPDPAGGNPAAKEDTEARDQGRRLAAAGRGDDLGRTIGQCGGRPLFRIEQRQQAVGGRCDAGWRDRHRSRMASAAYRPINSRLLSVEVALVPGNRRNAGSIRTCAADLRRSGVLAQIPFSARYGPGSLGADVNIAGVSGTQRGALAAQCETGLQP
jgi:hypothetical protein